MEKEVPGMKTAARVKGRKSVGRSHKKSRLPKFVQKRTHKFLRFNVPHGIVAAIQKEWLDSNNTLNLTALGKKYGISRLTVSAIVHCPEMEKISEQMQKKLLVMMSDNILDRIELEVLNPLSDKGADIAMDLAERWGAIPPRIKVSHGFGRGQETSVPVDDKPGSEEKRIKNWVQLLTEVTMERGKVFGMPMPELDELAQEERIEIPLKMKKEQAE